MYKCPSCGEDAPFYIVHVQDTTERSAKGPCCFTRGGDLTPEMLDGYRIVGGEPTNARALSAAEAVTAWDDYRALHPSETAADEEAREVPHDGPLAPGEAATSPGGAAVVGGFARPPASSRPDGTTGGAGPIPAPSGGADTKPPTPTDA